MFAGRGGPKPGFEIDASRVPQPVSTDTIDHNDMDTTKYLIMETVKSLLMWLGDVYC